MNKSPSVLGVLRMKLKAGDSAYRRGDFQSAMTNYQSVRNQAEKIDHQGLLSVVLIKSAVCLSALGRLAEAEELLHQAESIESSRHILDVDEVVSLHHELSVLLFRLNRFEEGLAEEKKALEILRRGDHIDNNLLVLVLKQLAVYMSRERQFSDAIGFLEDAMNVASSSEEIGKDSLLYGQLLVTYALLKIDMRKLEEAKALYAKGITLIQIGLGEDNPKLTGVYKLLEQHLKDAGFLAESTEFAQRVLELGHDTHHLAWY